MRTHDSLSEPLVPRVPPILKDLIHSIDLNPYEPAPFPEGKQS